MRHSARAVTAGIFFVQARMEPLGIIVFSCIMGTAGFSVILEAIRQFVEHTKTELPHESWVVGENLSDLELFMCTEVVP